jgi:ATP-binding cassette subfamily F protein 3
MLSNANFLLLDEPTNHLDTASKEILEEALNTYEGTVFYVSHDRFFVNRTATRILDLNDGRLDNYIGNYDYYLEKRDVVREAAAPSSVGSDYLQASPIPGGKLSPKVTDEGSKLFEKSDISDSSLSWQQQKAEQARIRKIQNRIKKIEEEIDANEKRSAEIDESLLDPEIATNAALLKELSDEQASLEAANEKLMEEWEELQL